MNDPETLAAQNGFSHWAQLNMAAAVPFEAVRAMCADGRCGRYGHNWACPPGCGTLEEISARAAAYRRGVLLQSTGTMEDDFDVETMQETERLQRERFAVFVERVRRADPDCLPMGTGGCGICAACTCPDAPCRFPDRAIPSMEAYGLWVSRVCERSGLPYYYGPGTITYTACVLVDAAQ